jgi:4-amino-4-deoxy-L-arabinose transferase-like glycosyltransferase
MHSNSKGFLSSFEFYDNTYSPKNSILLFFGLFFLVNLFLVGNHISLWDDDEAAYAGFALNMYEYGNWVNPEFTWSDVHRKTPFHFWSITISYYIFGVNEFAVRFPSSLAVLFTSLILLRLTGPLFGKANAQWSFIVFSSSFLCISMAKMSLTDAWLMFFETLAVVSLLRYLQRPAIIWNLLLWTSVSIGILVKGPPIIILIGGVWLGLAILHPDRKRLIGTHPWFFGLLSLIPFVLWAWLSYKNDDGKLLVFLYEWYVVKRIGGVVFGQTGPLGYHFVVAIIAFLAWLPLFLKGFWRVMSSPRKSIQHSALFCWLLFGWGFYELMSSKLPSYAMGAHPAMALATAMVLVDFLKSENISKIAFKLAWFSTAVLWILIGIAIYPVFRILFSEQSAYLPFISAIISLSAIPIFIVGKQLKFLFAGIWGAIFIIMLWGPLGTIFDSTAAKSSRTIILEIKKEADKFETSKNVPLVLCGFSNRQLRMSFPIYARLHFKEIREYTKEQFLEAAQKGEKMMVLLGEEHLPEIKNLVENKLFVKRFSFGQLPEWKSLNDQLKVHPFMYWHNLEIK